MESNEDVVKKMIKTVEPVKFTPKKINIQVDDKEPKKEAPV